MKKTLAILLIISFLVGPISGVALTYDNDSDFYDYVASQGMNSWVEFNGEKVYANREIFNTYNLIVYGQPFGTVKTNPTGKWHIQENRPFVEGDHENYRGELRYLGYTSTSEPFANPNFPADSLSGRTLDQFSYIPIDYASSTWGRISSELKNYLASQQLTADQVGGSISINEIGGASYAKLQLLPSWGNVGSVLVNHKDASGKVWYIELELPRLNTFGDSSLEVSAAAPEAVAMTKSMDTVTYEVDASALVKMAGFAKAEHIKDLSLKISEQSKAVSYTNTIDDVYTVTLHRDQLKVGDNFITIPVTGHYETIYSTESTPDQQSKTINVTTKVIVEAPEEPYITYNLEATPSEAQYNNANINIDVTATVALFNVDPSRVSTFSFDINGQDYTVDNKSSATEVYSTTITVTEMESVEDSITKVFSGTAKATLTDGSKVTQYAQDSSFIYKNTAMPIVSVQSPSPIKAGEMTVITALAYSPNGTPIDYYMLGYDNGAFVATDTSLDRSHRGYWTVEGIHSIDAYAQDILGNGGYGMGEVEVLAPTIESKYTATGQLKENRVITITASRNTPDLYPVDETRRSWNVITSGNLSAAEVNYLPVPAQNESFQFSPGDDGSIEFTLHEENTAGYTSDYTKTLNIVPDQAPVASFIVNDTIFRDPEDGNRATIQVHNASYSPDNDEIGRVVVSYQYDANNDGIFNEPWITEYDGNYFSQIPVRVDDVGDYRIKLSVFETFPVVDGLNSTSDFLSAEAIKQVKVDNMAPTVSMDLVEKESFELVSIIGDSKYADIEVSGAVGSYFSPQLANRYLSMEQSSQTSHTITEKYTMATSILENESYGFSGTPYMTNDGRYIAAIQNISGTNYLYVKDLEGNREGRISVFEYSGIAPRVLSIYGNVVVVGTGSHLVRYSFTTSGTLTLTQQSVNYRVYSRRAYSWTGSSGPINLRTNSDIYYLPVAASPNGRFIAVYIGRSSISEDDGYMSFRVVDLATNYVYTAAEDRISQNSSPSSISIDDSGTLTTMVTDDDDGDMDYREYSLTNNYYRSNIFIDKMIRNTKVYSYLDEVFTQISNDQIHYVDDFHRGIEYMNYTINGTRGISGVYESLDKGITFRKDQVTIASDGSQYTYRIGGDAPVVIGTHTELGLPSAHLNYFSPDFSNGERGMVYEAPYTYYGSYGSRIYQLDVDKTTTLYEYIDNLSFTSDSNYVVLYQDTDNVAFSTSKHVTDLKTMLNERGITLILITDGELGNNLVDEKHRIDSSGLTINQVQDQVLEIIASENDPERIDAGFAFLLDSEVTFETLYSDYESDPLNDMQLMIDHVDPDYFDNGFGTYASSGVWGSPENVVLDKPGLYEFTMMVQDNPLSYAAFDDYKKWSDEFTVTVYAHRAPVADFSIAGVYTDGFDLLNNSYDPDRTSQPDKGIVTSVWRHKEVNAASWTDGLPTTTDPSTEYLIELTVYDEFGATGTTIMSSFGGSSFAPIMISASIRARDADFSHNLIPASEYIELYDITSTYSQAHHLSIEVLNSGGGVYSSTTVAYDEGITGNKVDNTISWYPVDLQVPETFSDGNYQVRIRAINDSDNVDYDELLLGYTVLTPIDLVASIDTDGTIITTTADTSKYVTSLQVTLYDGIVDTNTLSMSSTPNGSIKDWQDIYNEERSIAGGSYNATFVATTPSGKSESVTLPFEITILNIVSFNVWGDWNHWRGQEDKITGETLSMDPHRFLSHENIHIEAEIEGEPDSVLVTMSAPLTSYVWTNSKGQIYYHDQDFDLPLVPHPLSMTTTNGTDYAVEYVLPLADWTLGYDNIRKQAPYWITITATKGATVETMTINDVELTGNIHDLVYVQYE